MGFIVDGPHPTFYTSETYARRRQLVVVIFGALEDADLPLSEVLVFAKSSFSDLNDRC